MTYKYNKDLWREVLSDRWNELSARRHINVPDWLPHPSVSGFTRIHAALSEGQAADWGLALPDGSRLHVWEFADESLRMHRDVHDPTQSPSGLLAHLWHEVPLGPVVILGLGYLAVRALERA